MSRPKSEIAAKERKEHKEVPDSDQSLRSLRSFAASFLFRISGFEFRIYSLTTA
jgi:hypothetical protein